MNFFLSKLIYSRVVHPFLFPRRPHLHVAWSVNQGKGAPIPGVRAAPSSCAPLVHKRGVGDMPPSYSHADPVWVSPQDAGRGEGVLLGVRGPRVPVPPLHANGGQVAHPLPIPAQTPFTCHPSMQARGRGHRFWVCTQPPVCTPPCAQSANKGKGANGEGGTPSHSRAASCLRVSPAPKPGVGGFACGPWFACPLGEGEGVQRMRGTAAGVAHALFTSPLCTRGEGGRRFPFLCGPPI